MDTAGMVEGAEVDAGAAARAADPMASEIAAGLSDPNPGNRRGYLASLYRRNRATMDDLEAAGVDQETCDYVAWSFHLLHGKQQDADSAETAQLDLDQLMTARFG